MLTFFRAKQYQLRIDNPCLENWNKMLPSEKGKFCQSCCKHVIDFTNLSDKEIIKIISKSSQPICGRIRKDQQNQVIVAKKETSSISLTVSKIAASLLFIGLSKNTNAIPLTYYPIHSTEHSPSNVSEKGESQQKGHIEGDSTLTVIKGKVLDAKTREEIPGVTILIKNSTIATSTDISGNFNLNIPNDLQKEEITILISTIGYITQEVVVNKTNASTKQEFLMHADSTSLTTVGALIAYKTKWWQIGRRLKSLRYRLKYKWEERQYSRQNREEVKNN